MAGSLSRALVALGGAGALVVACSERDARPFSEEARIAATQQAVFTSPEVHTGADLPNKTLVLTFDDGPSYRGAGGQTRAISKYLKGKGIKATFFVVGGCVAGTNLPAEGCSDASDDADGTIKQIFADGHLVGNHTTTHRDMNSLSSAAVMTDVSETNEDLAPYAGSIPWNHWFFRAPQGNWSNAFSTAADANQALKKYIGPIYWNAGGDIDQGRAADWNCWPSPKSYSTKNCGDRYLAEIRSQGKGIVLMHDQEYSSNLALPASPTAADYAPKVGNTYLLVHYIVEALEAEGGWSYSTLDKVPSIAAVMPKCHASCGTCKGPTATDCVTCAGSTYLASGACKACTTCGAGTFASTPCGAADTVCTTCAVCPAGQHATTACTATANTVCTKDDETPVVLDAGTTADATTGEPTTPGSGGGGTTPAPTPATADAGGNGVTASSDGGGCALTPASPRGSSSVSAVCLVGLALILQRRRRLRGVRA